MAGKGGNPRGGGCRSTAWDTAGHGPGHTGGTAVVGWGTATLPTGSGRWQPSLSPSRVPVRRRQATGGVWPQWGEWKGSDRV